MKKIKSLIVGSGVIGSYLSRLLLKKGHKVVVTSRFSKKTHNNYKILKISKKDPYRQYLAYYKGWGDYKNYSKDQKAIIYAKSTKDFASKYRKQLTTCRDQLNKKKYIIY